ncbi:hypothetical protein HYQ46_004516 [Verticillium longisporum]|nr:hypothetical protein HYQ46_004516 [Verticillium longisporum]
MDQSVTHLLCTDEQYKARKKIKTIKEAQQKGSRIRVVHYDWFEFSCNRNKKLPEKEYYFDNLLAEERAKRRKQLAKARSQRNLAIGEHWINPDLYRVFADVCPFEYQVELFRIFTDSFGTCKEKYVLYLFQSFAKPTLYWFGVKYYKKDDGKRWLLKAINRPSPCSRPFYTEFDKFKDFFRLKTATHSSFSTVENSRSLNVLTFDEAAAGTDAAQAQLIQESIDQAAKDANGEEGHPKDDPAHTNQPVEDFDTRVPSFTVMSARTAAHGSSGIEVHCFMDQKAGEHRSGTSMALSNKESSGEDDYVLSQGPNTAMQTHISPADEASNLTQCRQSAPRTEACFAPFAEEESMFQSSDLHPDVSAHFKPKTN